MDRRRGDAEQLLPLWAGGEAEFIQDAEELRGTSGPRCRRRVAAAVALALAACALAALGSRSRGVGGGRGDTDVDSRVALDAYTDAAVPTALGAAAGSPRLASGVGLEGQLPNVAYGSYGGYASSEEGLEGSPAAMPELPPTTDEQATAYSEPGSNPTNDEQAQALLSSMLSPYQVEAAEGVPQDSLGEADTAATAGQESEWGADAEAAAAAQWAQAQNAMSASAGAAATPAVAADTEPSTVVAADTEPSIVVVADTEPSTVATTSLTTVITSITTTPTTAQETTTATTSTPTSQTTKTATTTLEKCGLVEPGIDYPGNDLKTIKDVLSAELCCGECAKDTDCVAWVWGQKRHEGFSDMCFLKGGHPRGQITRVANPDVVSGQPTQVGRFIPTLNRTSGQSLFCFALMLPKSYESDLLAYQYENAGGVFGCDEYAIYSNVSTEIATGCSTLKVDMDLHSEMGGEFGTALNTGVFLSIWQSVVGAGRYKLHDWTVKVDPDSVFFSPRLRLLVQAYEEADSGVYLNNCQFGLHGPLEVFSTNAVTAWDGAQERCRTHFWKLCDGDCNWGEDMFIDQCLNYTGVQRVDDFNQLLEDHCDPPDDWDECLDPVVVAFHPFKTLKKQKACVENAMGSSP